MVPLCGQGPEEGQQPAVPLILPQAVVLPRGSAEIAIDGSLADWPESPAIPMSDQRQLSGTGMNAWRGPQDLSGMAFLMWDEKALYFSAVVRDEWHRPLDGRMVATTEIPAADCIVLTFDPARNTRALGTDPGRDEDREFWLADEARREVMLWDRLRGSARVLEKDARMVVLHDKEQSLTSYEARIPWSEILPPGSEAKAGLVFDMQIVINDFDETTDGMPQTRIGWTFGCGPIIDPGLLGSVMLVADATPLQGLVPDFPAKPSAGKPAAPPAEYWDELTARLLRLPAAVHDGSKAPEEAGGLDRLSLLQEIDEHCEQFPRVDLLEFHHRIHRRMSREVAGIQARGLPSWWRARLLSVSKAAEDPVEAGRLRLFRLPMGGWLVRTRGGSYLIDPAGADLAEWLWGGAQFCVLTQPLDMTRRNDQLLLRMLLAESPRPVFHHVVFHLPVVTMDKMPLVAPGTTIGPETGMHVQAFGRKDEDGSVDWSCSYLIAVPGAPEVLVIGPSQKPEEIEAEGVEVMILSPRNPNAVEIAKRVQPGLVVLDDVFLCQSRPEARRVRVNDLHEVQRALLPLPSLILAPGESWDVSKRGQ
jgi:hypothetical protein